MPIQPPPPPPPPPPPAPQTESTMVIIQRRRKRKRERNNVHMVQPSSLSLSPFASTAPERKKMSRKYFIFARGKRKKKDELYCTSNFANFGLVVNFKYAFLACFFLRVPGKPYLGDHISLHSTYSTTACPSNTLLNFFCQSDTTRYSILYFLKGYFALESSIIFNTSSACQCKILCSVL